MTEKIGDTDYGVQVGLGFIGQVTMAVLGFAGSIVVARVLGPESYGLFYVALSIAAFLKNPITGWAVACEKRLTETDFDESEALGSVLLVSVTATITSAPLSYLVLGQLTQNPLIPLVVPLLFGPIALHASLIKLLSGRANFSMSTWGSVLKVLFKTTLQVVFVVLGFGVWGMVGGLVVGAILAVPVIYHWLKIKPAIPSRKAVFSIAGFAKWSVPMGFVGTALSRMDTLLLGWLATAGAAGHYQVAFKLSIPAVFVSAAVGKGLMGRVSNLRSRDEEWRDDIRNALSFNSILAIPCFFGSLALSEQIIATVFGSAYSGAGLFLIGLTLYRLVSTQTGPFGNTLAALDRPDIDFRISLARLTTNLVFGVGLWYIFGAIGIVAGTVIAQIVAYIGRIISVQAISGEVPVVTRSFLAQVFSGVTMFGLLALVDHLMQISGSIKVFGVVVIAGIIYFAVLLTVSPHLRDTATAISRDFWAIFAPSD